MSRPIYRELIRSVGLSLQIIGHTRQFFHFILLPFKTTRQVEDFFLHLQGICFTHFVLWFKINLDVKIISLQTLSKQILNQEFGLTRKYSHNRPKCTWLITGIRWYLNNIWFMCCERIAPEISTSYLPQMFTKRTYGISATENL